MRNLHERVIVITGASSGIGAATAIACAQAGMHVVLGARRETELAKVAEQVRALGVPGVRAVALRCEVDSDADVAALIDAAVREFGRLDAAFANAGYGFVSPVLDTPDQRIRAIFETNFYGTIRVLRAAAPVMRKQGAGHLLICSSAASEIGMPMYGYYSATKAAQDSIAGALRAEVSGEGIHVSSVHPIGTRTEFFDRVGESAPAGSVGFNTPGFFLQTPQRVARAIVRCLRRPKPEVWPNPASRFGLAFTTAFPRLGALAMRRMYRSFRA